MANNNQEIRQVLQQLSTICEKLKSLEQPETPACTEPKGVYDQLSVTFFGHHLPLSRYFDVVECIYVVHPEKFHACDFELRCNDVGLDKVKPCEDGRLPFFGGENMNLLVGWDEGTTKNWIIEYNWPEKVEFKVIGYNLAKNDKMESSNYSCVLVPVIAYGRRNTLIVDKDGLVLKHVKKMSDAHINVKTIPGFEHLVEQRLTLN